MAASPYDSPTKNVKPGTKKTPTWELSTIIEPMEENVPKVSTSHASLEIIDDDDPRNEGSDKDAICEAKSLIQEETGETQQRVQLILEKLKTDKVKTYSYSLTDDPKTVMSGFLNWIYPCMTPKSFSLRRRLTKTTPRLNTRLKGTKTQLKPQHIHKSVNASVYLRVE